MDWMTIVSGFGAGKIGSDSESQRVVETTMARALPLPIDADMGHTTRAPGPRPPASS